MRKHALRLPGDHGCDLETAALRVFSNCDGAYGSNVNHLVDNGRWEDEDELAETFTRRKSFAYGRSGWPCSRRSCSRACWPRATWRTRTSTRSSWVSPRSTTISTRSAESAARCAATRATTVRAVYIGDQTAGTAKVRTLTEQMASRPAPGR